MDDVNLYITTYNEYRKAKNLESFSYYEKSPNIYSDSGEFTVPFEDTWVFFVYNPNFKSVRVTYEITVTTGISGFTGIPTLMGLAILGAVAAVRKRTRRKII